MRPALAAIDVGTNSVHLVVARPTGGSGFETITREKEMVRLGSGGGDMKRIAPDAIDRGVAALTRMKHIADSHDAHVRAVATSATREALNAGEFIARSADEAGVNVEVISGAEEARLIHLGVLQAVPVFDRRLLLVDIGGGSTELLLGESGETLAARSFKVGAVRLTDRFFPRGDVTKKSVKECRDHIRSMIEHFRREVAVHGFDVTVASSGTAETLARMVDLAARSDGDAEPLRTYNCFEFTADDLDAIVGELTARATTSARAKLPGLETARAEIIVAGALILATVAETLAVGSFTFSDAALREGVLLDTMSRIDTWRADGNLRQEPDRLRRPYLRDVTRRSIDRLVDRCDDDPEHSRHVARLAVALYDELPELHGIGPAAREYLEAAALLANVGLVVAHSKHHLHTYYLVRNCELAGLTDAEIEIVAQIARYHRKSAPKPSHAPFAALDAKAQTLVRTLAAVLRVAIGLDRRHQGRVAGVKVVDDAAADGDTSTLTIAATAAGDDEIDLEVYSAAERASLLERVIDRPVAIVPASASRDE